MGMAVFFSIINCFAQISPYNQNNTTVSTEKKSQDQQIKLTPQEERIIAEINGAYSPKDNLLEAVQKFFIPTSLQSKYTTLLKILPGMLPNFRLLEAIDEWYGTRYRYGGTTKNGIDCSAFVRAVYKAAFNIDLPRTAREQFNAADETISLSSVKAGDLLFFNTRGGVSHVGVYLGNNKFVHASSSHGVTVSDLNEKYYSARFLGARRIEK